jgi:hypothetical protein
MPSPWRIRGAADAADMHPSLHVEAQVKNRFRELDLGPVDTDEITEIEVIENDESKTGKFARTCQVKNDLSSFVTFFADYKASRWATDVGLEPQQRSYAATRGAADPAYVHPSLRNSAPARFNPTGFEPRRTQPVRAHLPIFTSWRPAGRERRPACSSRSKGSRRVTRAGPSSSSDDPPGEGESEYLAAGAAR